MTAASLQAPLTDREAMDAIIAVSIIADDKVVIWGSKLAEEIHILIELHPHMVTSGASLLAGSPAMALDHIELSDGTWIECDTDGDDAGLWCHVSTFTPKSA